MDRPDAWLNYQFEEIEKANLKISEDQELEAKREIILNSEKINENLSIADLEISEKTIDSINSAIRALEKIETFNEEYGKELNVLKSTYYDIQEIARDISNLREETYFDEKERQDVETRLDIIFSLKRKYGNTIEEILGVDSILVIYTLAFWTFDSFSPWYFSGRVSLAIWIDSTSLVYNWNILLSYSLAFLAKLNLASDTSFIAWIRWIH